MTLISSLLLAFLTVGSFACGGATQSSGLHEENPSAEQGSDQSFVAKKQRLAELALKISMLDGQDRVYAPESKENAELTAAVIPVLRKAYISPENEAAIEAAKKAGDAEALKTLCDKIYEQIYREAIAHMKRLQEKNAVDGDDIVNHFLLASLALELRGIAPERYEIVRAAIYELETEATKLLRKQIAEKKQQLEIKKEQLGSMLIEMTKVHVSGNADAIQELEAKYGTMFPALYAEVMPELRRKYISAYDQYLIENARSEKNNAELDKISDRIFERVERRASDAVLDIRDDETVSVQTILEFTILSVIIEEGAGRFPTKHQLPAEDSVQALKAEILKTLSQKP